MLRGVGFTAMLYCMALAGLGLGLMSLYQKIEWHFAGHAALMELVNPSRKFDAPMGGTVFTTNIKYVEPTGETQVPGKWVTVGVAERLARGDKIPIFFQKSNLQRALYSKDELDSPWGWLAFGIVALLVARFAKKLLRAESE